MNKILDKASILPPWCAGMAWSSKTLLVEVMPDRPNNWRSHLTGLMASHGLVYLREAKAFPGCLYTLVQPGASVPKPKLSLKR